MCDLFACKNTLTILINLLRNLIMKGETINYVKYMLLSKTISKTSILQSVDLQCHCFGYKLTGKGINNYRKCYINQA